MAADPLGHEGGGLQVEHAAVHRHREQQERRGVRPHPGDGKLRAEQLLEGGRVGQRGVDQLGVLAQVRGRLLRIGIGGQAAGGAEQAEVGVAELFEVPPSGVVRRKLHDGTLAVSRATGGDGAAPFTRLSHAGGTAR